MPKALKSCPKSNKSPDLVTLDKIMFAESDCFATYVVRKEFNIKGWNIEAVVVAQLVERSPPTPEIRSSYPVIGKTFIEHLLTVNCVEKTKIKKKEAGNSPLKKVEIFTLRNACLWSLILDTKRHKQILAFGREFESQHHLLDGLFSHLFVERVCCNVCLKRRNKLKWGRGWPI